MHSNTGWVVPVRTDLYRVKSNTVYITTDSVSGSSDKVMLALIYGNDDFITAFKWRFSDWHYQIEFCTPSQFHQRFNSTPPAERNKIWEVTIGNAIQIKCNGVEVLYLKYEEAINYACTSQVKGKKVEYVRFWNSDTATKKMTSNVVGK